MKCRKCGSILDPKYKKCPRCSEPISRKDRVTELKTRKKASKGRRKNIFIDENIAAYRQNEDIPAYYGRGSRNQDSNISDYIPIIAVVVSMLLIILSAGIISQGRKQPENTPVLYASKTDASASADDSDIDIKESLAATPSTAQRSSETEAPGEGTKIDESKIVEASTSNKDSEEKSSNDNNEIAITPQQLDLYQGGILQSVITDILENGEQSYIDYLNKNKNKVTVISEDMLNDDPSGAYDCIWRGLGSVALVPEYKDNGAVSYSFSIDDEGELHIYIATEEDPAAYELYPDTDDEYKTD